MKINTPCHQASSNEELDIKNKTVKQYYMQYNKEGTSNHPFSKYGCTFCIFTGTLEDALKFQKENNIYSLTTKQND